MNTGYDYMPHPAISMNEYESVYLRKAVISAVTAPVV
jgi:hypothetical protein